jgi:hypothetical protein
MQQREQLLRSLQEEHQKQIEREQSLQRQRQVHKDQESDQMQLDEHASQSDNNSAEASVRDHQAQRYDEQKEENISHVSENKEENGETITYR